MTASRGPGGIWIGLAAIAATVVLGGEARGQGSVESDKDVLEAFYHAAGGPNWRNSTNWLGDAPLSEWYGVVTNLRGRVEVLALYDNRLVGRIPPELGELNLEGLILAGNQLTGPIPPQLSQLARLESLILADNRLNGPIPPELGRLTRLHVLQVHDNRLSGPIPPELGRPTRLQVLSLSDNQLSGPIPPELGQLTRLELLEFDGNLLHGPIPPELGRLTALQLHLGLGGNRLSGPIPPELGRLTRLERLSLQANRLSGPIPVELGNLTQLNRLSIDGDTGLCLPLQIRDAVFGLLALENEVPLCDSVAALPGVASWALALAIVLLALRRNGLERQPIAYRGRRGRSVPAAHIGG